MDPPPLPPKTRAPPEAAPATVLSNFTVFPSDNCADEPEHHVVKIRINPTIDKVLSAAPCSVRISVNNSEISPNTMVDTSLERSNSAYFFYNTFAVMSSGQVSPSSDTLDSGTCSDLDSPKKQSVSVTLIQHHKRASSLASSADSDDNESSISCDSLNSGKVSPASLPSTLLQDIRQRSEMKLPDALVKSYQERKNEKESASLAYESDMFYNFHINEHIEDAVIKPIKEADESFAGYKDILGGSGASTIRSAKGTVRGVKNRVRAGIATFLQINSDTKNYKEKEQGKVVVYTTTMGILRETYQACNNVKRILRTLLVKFEERDVFMNSEYQNEIRDRMRCDQILVPQVFVDGQHVGDAETVERLNECGELRRILKPFKSMDVCTTCKMCGGFRLLPCQVCNGSKKSVHRNHFTAEFVALKCMNCDEVGLVKCNACS